MAVGRHFRQDKRMPSFYVMGTAVIFVAFCLIGIWVFSSPSESGVAVETVDVKLRSKETAESDNQPLEDSSQELQPGSKKKTVENLDTKSDSKESPELDTQQKGLQDSEDGVEETPQAKPDSKESAEVDSEQTDEENLQEKASKLTVTDKSAVDKLNDDGEGKVLNSDVKEGEQVQKVSEVVEEKPQKDSELEENGGAQSEIQIENKETAGNWATQASESKEEKEKVELEEEQKSDDQMSDEKPKNENIIEQTREKAESQDGGESKSRENFQTKWALCEFEGATDYIPCLDNKEAIQALPSTKHYEHRERHCPTPAPTCLVPLPKGYRIPVPWPKSRNEVWFNNVPHPGLVSYKKDQNWVKKSGDRLLFPGGGTQFKHGALHYIDFIEQTLPDIAWGNHTRVILDVGCGVASFGGYMFEREVLTMSFAPKDEHEAQIQLALERGIPAISSVMGTQRLVFPSNVYDAVHCARCRVPWHIEGGKLLLELNRVLRPGGYFIWSATPVYWKDKEDASIWKEMAALTAAMCWDLVAKTTDSSTGVGVAIFHKPTTNFCYENRRKNNPPMCDEDDKPDAAWYIPMTACIHKIPAGDESRATEWPQEWPMRLTTAPTWLNSAKGLYGKPAAADFRSDTEHWQRVVEKSYLRGLGIDWTNVRNVMDMKAVYGGFAAALASQSVWVMNVVPFDAADTLPVIFDRGLFGIYHDWCESLSSYPRTYDLLHSDHLFGKMKKRCDFTGTIVEMDRLLRPQGWAIFRDRVDTIQELQALLVSLHWDVRMTYAQGNEGLLAVQKTKWRPEVVA